MITKTSGSLILTKKEMEVIDKKLKNMKLTQQDSNYLSKFVRPKLREISLIDARYLLCKLEYNQKIASIEKRIKEIILKKIKNVISITLYGSAIQNNYKNYNDLDVLILVNKKFWKKLGEKYRQILEIKKVAKKYSLNLDLEIYDKKIFQRSYPSNISLIYQLKDKKSIYGHLKLPSKLEIPKLNLRMKIDYSILEGEKHRGLEIYKAIRNLILINLVLKRTIDNKELINSINKELGENLANKLKSNKESGIDRKIAFLHLNQLLRLILKKLKESKWEKIVLLNP